jgi:hypothetical protein
VIATARARSACDDPSSLAAQATPGGSPPKRLRAKAEANLSFLCCGEAGLLRGACHRARVRATRWLAMTRKHVCPFSRHGLPEVLRIRCPSLEERGRRECRVRAAPAVSCAKRLRIGAHEHTGQRRTLRHPLRNGFTAYSALSPATNSFCHRHLRIGSSAGPVGPTSPPQTWHQQRMPGPHSFTVRNRVARLVCRSIAHEVHLALQSQARTTLPRPPHPIPTLVTMANAPPRG